MKFDPLFKNANHLPVLPKVLQNLLVSFNDDTLRADLLARQIEQDPVINARLLRLANSACYQMPQTISTAHQAVQQLGMVNVRSLVISIGLAGCLSGLPPALIQPYWRHSLHTATAARYWASGVQIDAELSYTLGLLHGIGQLVLRTVYPDAMLRLDQQTGPFAPGRRAAEREEFGYDHADVGAGLACHWQLPPLFAIVIAGAMATSDTSDAARLTALVQVATWQSWVSDQLFNEDQIETTWPAPLALQVGLDRSVCGQHFPPWAQLCAGLEDCLIFT